VIGPRSFDDVPAEEGAARPSFAHESEAELARILDFYAVRWSYEPHTYPILWDLEGSVLESFSPDFYLPDLDMYIELTTLKQRLVRKKNRKLRRLRELYPDIRIKLFYARDFRMLMLKYGKVALVDALSGTSGQVVPPPRPPRPSHAIEVADGVSAAGSGPVAADAAIGGREDAWQATKQATKRDAPRRRARRNAEERTVADATIPAVIPPALS
jgi:hypothetical protein